MHEGDEENQMHEENQENQDNQDHEGHQVQAKLKSFTLVDDCELNRAAYLHLLNQIRASNDTAMDE